MRLKIYNTPTLHAALRLARIELGSEAVLLEAKERDAETAEGRFEVTFALGADGEIPPAPPPPRLEAPHWKTFLTEAQARETLEEPPWNEPRVEAAPKPRARPAPLDASAPGEYAALRTPALAALFGRLAAVGVRASEASSLAVQAAASAGCEDDPAALEMALAAILDAGWKIHSNPEPAPKATRTIALVGPAGAGKSATAIRAAMLLLHAYDRPAALVSLGRHRVGGVEALDAWATLLGLRLEIEETPERLPDALERLARGARAPGAVLVDLPSDLSAAKAVRAAGIETHLVLPAVYSAADLDRTVERYEPFAPAAVICTRLDEAAAPGALWHLQRNRDLPASFLGCGPETPGDLYRATARRLTARLLGR